MFIFRGVVSIDSVQNKRADRRECQIGTSAVLGDNRKDRLQDP
jgi:hypothetical protein